MRSDIPAAMQPETALRQGAESSVTTAHPATLTALRQTRGSGYSREFLRESVLAWATHRWPELFIGHSACEPTFESRSERSQVRVTCARNGRYMWSLNGIRPDAKGNRHWHTRVLVLSDEEHDLVGVSTGYLGDVGTNVPVAQPAFLSGLIEHLPFEDGGHPVCTVPRQVFDERAFVNLQDHLCAVPCHPGRAPNPVRSNRALEEPPRLDARSMARHLAPPPPPRAPPPGRARAPPPRARRGRGAQRVRGSSGAGCRGLVRPSSAAITHYFEVSGPRSAPSCRHINGD